MIPVSFFQRPYPSANVVLLHGSRPVLVDTGFGADVPELLHWLETQSVAPSALCIIVNTHFRRITAFSSRRRRTRRRW